MQAMYIVMNIRDYLIIYKSTRMSIYRVSKLLGHALGRTTEQHYAPLLTVEIEDFEL